MDGVSLADQSYQSFKNKEIRDSESPTGDGGFVQKTMRNINSNDGVLKPNTSGWNITSSSTVNPDGSGYKNESLATTEGSRKIDGGQHEFAGINQHMEKASHHGDDKNFVKSAAESSNTKLQESTVVGDEKSGRIEKKSSTVVSSSSKSFSQKQTSSGNAGDFDPNIFGIDRPSGQFPAIERRDSMQSNASNATDYSTRSNTNQSLKEKLAMTRQNVESRATSSIREEEFHHQTQSRTSSSTTNQQQQQQIHQQHNQPQQQEPRHYEIGGKHHLRETDNYEREHQRYQEELERKLAQEISQQQKHHTEQRSSTTTTEHATSHHQQQQQQQQQQQKILRQSENISREEQQRQQINRQQNTTSAIDNIDERYLTKYTDNTGTTIKKSGVINKDSPPELQAQFEKLKAQPGRIISEEISYPKPGVKMITTKKELSDGTVVTTRDYETKAPTERVVQEKVIAGNTERSQHVKYNTNTEQTDRQFTKSVDQRNKQILRNTDAIDSSKTDRTIQSTNRDVVDHSRVRHDDYVEKIRDAVETLDVNRTVKKDLSKTIRDEKLTQADFVETDRGCVLIDRNTGRPQSERYTTPDNCDRNAALREDRQEYEHQTRNVRQQKVIHEDDTRSTHGFPSQRVPDENRSPGEKIHKIYKEDDGFRGTHGFPSARSPDRKSQYSTSSTTQEHYEQRTRSNQHDEDFRGTHGFPSARTPGDGDQPTRRPEYQDQYPQKSIPREDDFLGTHGFPSAREPSGRYSPSVSSEVSEHYEKRTQKTTDESFLGTHGFPSARGPEDHPHDRHPISPGTPKSKQPTGADFRGTHGFPSVPVEKNERQTRVETQQQQQQQQYTTSNTVKHVDAAHEAFARSLRCVSPIDNTRRGSNASQRSYRTNTHGSTRSHDSPARERSVLSDSSHISSGTVTKGTTARTPTKHHSKEVHHSNETIDLPSKTVHTKTTTTKISSHDATPGELIKKKNVSNLNRNLGIKRITPVTSSSPSKIYNRNLNKKPITEPEIKKKTAFVDDRFIGAVEVVEEACVKKKITPLCPDGCPLPKKVSTTSTTTNTKPNVLKKTSITKKNLTPSSSGKPLLKTSTKSPTKSYLQPTTASKILNRSTPSTIKKSDSKDADRPSVRPTTRSTISTKPTSLTRKVTTSTTKTGTTTTKPLSKPLSSTRKLTESATKKTELRSSMKSPTRDVRSKSRSPGRVDFQTKATIKTTIRSSSKSPVRATSKSPVRSSSKSPTRRSSSRSPIHAEIALDQRSPFKHYLEPTESVKTRLNAAADDYVEQELRKKNDHRFEPIGIEIIDKRSKSRSPARSSVSPTRSSVATSMSRTSFEEKMNEIETDALTEDQIKQYIKDFETTDINDESRPFTIKGPLPKSCPEGYIPIQVTKKITTDFKEISDSAVDYPEFLKRPKTPTKGFMGYSPTTSPERRPTKQTPHSGNKKGPDTKPKTSRPIDKGTTSTTTTTTKVTTRTTRNESPRKLIDKEQPIKQEYPTNERRSESPISYDIDNERNINRNTTSTTSRKIITSDNTEESQSTLTRKTKTSPTRSQTSPKKNNQYDSPKSSRKSSPTKQGVTSREPSPNQKPISTKKTSTTTTTTTSKTTKTIDDKFKKPEKQPQYQQFEPEYEPGSPGSGHTTSDFEFVRTDDNETHTTTHRTEGHFDHIETSSKYSPQPIRKPIDTPYESSPKYSPHSTRKTEETTYETSLEYCPQPTQKYPSKPKDIDSKYSPQPAKKPLKGPESVGQSPANKVFPNTDSPKLARKVPDDAKQSPEPTRKLPTDSRYSPQPTRRSPEKSPEIDLKRSPEGTRKLPAENIQPTGSHFSPQSNRKSPETYSNQSPHPTRKSPEKTASTTESTSTRFTESQKTTNAIYRDTNTKVKKPQEISKPYPEEFEPEEEPNYHDAMQFKLKETRDTQDGVMESKHVEQKTDTFTRKKNTQEFIDSERFDAEFIEFGREPSPINDNVRPRSTSKEYQTEIEKITRTSPVTRKSPKRSDEPKRNDYYEEIHRITNDTSSIDEINLKSSKIVEDSTTEEDNKTTYVSRGDIPIESDTEEELRQPFFLKEQAPINEDTQKPVQVSQPVGRTTNDRKSDAREPKKEYPKEQPKSKTPFTRSETFEERCRQMLGISDTSEKTVTTTASKKHHNTTEFITNERRYQDSFFNRKSSSPSPLPSPRSSSPQKLRDSDVKITVTTTENVTKTSLLDKEVHSDVDSIKTRSASPSPIRRSKAPTRETSPSQRPDHPEVSHRTVTKKITTDSFKDTYSSSPYDSPYSRSPDSSPVRRPGTDSAYSRSPDSSPVREPLKSTRATTIKDKEKPSKETSPIRSSTTIKTGTIDKETKTTYKTTDTHEMHSQTRDQSPEQPKHITTARIQISPPSVRKTPSVKTTSPTRQPNEPRKTRETSPTGKPIHTGRLHDVSPSRKGPNRPHNESPSRESFRTVYDSSPVRSQPRDESPLRKPTGASKPHYESPTRSTTGPGGQPRNVSPSIRSTEPNKPHYESPTRRSTEPNKPHGRSPSPKRTEPNRPYHESPTRKSVESASIVKNKILDAKTKTTISTSHVTNKATSPSKDSPRKPKEKDSPTKPGIRKNITKRESLLTSEKVTRGDIEIDESDVVSDDEDILIIETTTKTTDTKKSTPTKKYPVTERKESAPVNRTTQIERDAKFTRSTSDNVFKTNVTKRTSTTKPSEPVSKTKPIGFPVESPKTHKKQVPDQKKDHRGEKRPSKCLTTKTINLTTTSNVLNSEDMENVVIDIQQAKSSREPSPNKIVPVPVSSTADDDHDGIPRYPDQVQEPEDSRRTPKVHNIPIFQETLNDFIGCQITEIKETDATIVDDKVDEDCLLSVHEKVHKFINTAEEIKKPKTSSPFKRDLPENEQYPVDDECLLSVNDKVNKFLSTAEKVTKDVVTSSGKRVVHRLNVHEIDEDLKNDECVLSVSEKVNKFINTAERLVESVPQKSPNLVAQVDRQISKHSEDERNFEPIKKQPFEPVATYIPNGSPYDHDDYPKAPKGTSKYPRDRSTSPINKQPKRKPSHPKEIITNTEIMNHKAVTQKTKITDRYAPNKPKEIVRTTSKPVIKTTETVRKAKSVFENGDVKTTTRTTTTTSSTPKQRDILSRPSVFEAKRNRELSDVKVKDIGIKKPFKDTDINRPESRPKEDKPQKTKPVTSTQSMKTAVTDSVSSRKNVFEQCTILSSNDIGAAALGVTERLTSKSTPRRRSGMESPTRKAAPESIHRRQPSTEYSRKPAIIKETTVTTNTRKVHSSPVKINNAEFVDEYIDKSKTVLHKKTPVSSKSPTRDTHDFPVPTTKQVFESNTECIDEFTDKYERSAESHYSRKDASSTISTKKVSDKTELYDIGSTPHRKPTDSIPRDLSPQGTKPVREETFTTTTVRRGDESPSVLARKNIFENPDAKLNGYSSPTHKPSYMDHTKSSLEHIRRDSLEINRTNYQRKTSFDEETFETNPKSAVKFGVHLKHSPSEHKPRRKSSSSEIPHIEEIFDLELLEQMLSTVVGYEQRRRIRSQIRIVKKLIEQKNREEAQIAYIRETSPARRSTPPSPRSASPTIRVSSRRREDITKKTEEEQVAYIRETSPARKSPVRDSTQRSPTRDSTQRSPVRDTIHRSPVRDTTKRTSSRDVQQRSPVRDLRAERTIKKDKYSKTSSNTSFIDNESRHIEKHETYSRERSISPKSKVKTVTTITEIRKVGGTNIPDKTVTTKKVIQGNTDEKPIWATKNILKKASETNRSPRTGVTTGITKKTQSSSTTRTSHTQSQKEKILSDEDVITSSYGIGPTDEDGRPLFGLRALKTKKPSETSKVTGTIVSESYYSENGHAPVGERKVTVYSTDPNDIDEYEANYDHKTRSDSIKRESRQRDGLTSVTRTQKFGDANKFDTRDTEALTDTMEFDSSKKVRRGSVKEMSEKFIRKESSSSVTEKTSSSSYPKAGLILRTKTKESSPATSRYRAGSYEDEEYESAGHEYESSSRRHESKTRSMHESESETESIKISKAKTSSTSTRSFLDSSGSKVTGVDDVLERMRNADNVVVDGDTMEDREARALLNKFLGASVLMSGVESMMPAQEVVTTKVTKINTEPVKEVVKTTRVTKTIKSEGNSSAPVSFGTSDIEEIWDEEILKELLEQSTSYEERRRIRARIKQLMAEREACADIVASVKAELENSQATKKPSPLQHQNSRKTTGIVEVENNDSDDDSSVYEEIIEEIEVTDTDGSDNDNGDEDDNNKNKNIKSVTTTTTKKIGCGNNKTETVVTTTKFVEKTKPKTEIVKTVIKSEPLRTSITPTNTTTTTTTTETKTKEATPTKITTEVKATKETDNKPGKNKKNIIETDNITVERVANNSNDKIKKIKTLPDKQKEKEDDDEEEEEEQEEEDEDEEEEAQEEDSDEEKPEDLLPLLQGLLHFSPTQKDQANIRKPNMSNHKSSSISNSKLNNSKSSNNMKTRTLSSNNSSNNMNNKNHSINNSISANNNHHIEDSGTESGEDLKLLAAGLRDSMQSIKNDTGLIPEVTAALTRLEKSLKEGTSDIQLDLKRRNALLTLVSRLQTGLTSPEKIKEPTPAPNHTVNANNTTNSNNMEASSPEADNCRGTNRQRFAKRRSRANRHTVGVSREELADARRYMEEMIIMQNLSHNTPSDNQSILPTTENQPLQKQNSSGAILTYSNQVNEVANQPITPNTTENSTKSTLYRPNQFIPSNNAQQTNHTKIVPSVIQSKPLSVQRRDKKLHVESAKRQSADYDQTQTNLIQNSKRPLSESYSSAIEPQVPQQQEQPQQFQYQTNSYDQQQQKYYQPIIQSQAISNISNGYTNNGTLPDYNESQNRNYHNQPNSAEIFEPSNVPLNRFSNKKLAMKRANTIDIPKPMKYINDMESDSEAEEYGVNSTKSIGLRGTVQVSVNKPKSFVQAFEPKTENDLKFLAFIQKQGPAPGLAWNSPNRTVSNWTNKFGNIKQAFETKSFESSFGGKPPVGPISSAKNFWKKNELQSNVSKAPYANDKIVKPPWSDKNLNSDVLSSALNTKERQNIDSYGVPNHFPQQQPVPQSPNQQSFHRPPIPSPVQHHQSQNSGNRRPIQSPIQQYSTQPIHRPPIQSPIQQQSIHKPPIQSPIQQQSIHKPPIQSPIQQQQPSLQRPSAIQIAKPIPLNKFSHAAQSVFKPVDPPQQLFQPSQEQFKPIQTDSRFHSDPYINHQPSSNTIRSYPDQRFEHDQSQQILTQQSQQQSTNKKISLVGKNSAPNSPHHFITSPVHNWAGTKRSTPTSPMTSSLPWVSKNRAENRIRSKAEKYDKKSPPPSNLHRQTSLHHQDKAFDQRKKDYGANLTDMKRPSLPDASDPFVVKGSLTVQPIYYASTPHIHNNSTNYEYDNSTYQKHEPLIQYQDAQKLHKSQPALEYNPPITEQDYGIMPIAPSINNEVQDFAPKYRSREDSLTNPDAQPLVLTTSCPTFDPHNTISENHKPLVLTNTCSTFDPQSTISESQKYPLKIFDYPSPATSMVSPMSYPHHEITTDDEVDSEILTEYKAESKVMTGPVSQQAVTVSGNKTQRIGDNEVYDKKSSVAKSLLSTMKNIKADDKNKIQKQISVQKQIPTPEICLSPEGRSYQAPLVEPVFPELIKVETNRAPEYFGQPHQSQPLSHYQQNPVYVPPQPIQNFSSTETIDYQQNSQYQQQLNQKLVQEKLQKEQLQKLEQQKLQQQYEEHKQKLEQERLQKEYEEHKKMLEQQRLQKEYEEHKKLMEQQKMQKEYEEHKKLLEQQRLQQEYEEHKKLLQQQQIQKEYEQQMLEEQKKIEQQKQQQLYQQQKIKLEEQQLKNINLKQQNMQSGNYLYQSSPPIHAVNGNPYQYSDIQKNLEQHRQIQETYPKQEQKQFQEYKPTPPARKKSAPKVEPITPVLNTKPVGPPKIGYQDLKPVKKQSVMSNNVPEKQTTFLKSSKTEAFHESQNHDTHSSQQTTKQQALKARQRSLEEQVIDEQQNQIIQSQQQISANTEIIKQKTQKKIATQQEIYQANKKLITEVQEESKLKFTKSVSQKNQQVTEKVEYKSSQPADTPDIVKSSLLKDDIPILKKFGPPQRHLYTPNAYKTPITKCESASNASKMSSTTTSTVRKMSEPSVLVKLHKQQSQPEIIETPATPAVEQEESIEEIIPRNIVFNNVAQFTNMSRRVSESSSDQIFNKNIASVKSNTLSKSDSWHQICLLQQQANAKPPSPKFGESGGNQLRRTKSGHSLAVPKMYEGSINRNEVSEKQNIVAAYFSGNKSPNSLSRNSSQTNITDNEKISMSSSSMTTNTTVKKSSINRTRTIDKTSIGKQMPSSGLVRSQTMPHIDKLNLLDESNVEDAFEQILLGS